MFAQLGYYICMPFAWLTRIFYNLTGSYGIALILFTLLCAILAGAFGWLFVLRVGGADMPITISLLNSLSGVAGGIAGMAIGEPLLVAVGGIVGASGLILTEVMCRAMNRKLSAILTGATTVSAAPKAEEPAVEEEPEPVESTTITTTAPTTQSPYDKGEYNPLTGELNYDTALLKNRSVLVSIENSPQARPPSDSTANWWHATRQVR